MIDEVEMPKLLGRPLTPDESSNFDLYIEIATDRLEQLLCTELTNSDTTDARTYDMRPGYRTLFVHPFTEATVVKLGGHLVDAADYTLKQWDNAFGTWKNSIVFNKRMGHGIAEVYAIWGFGTPPADLKLLLARLFNISSYSEKNYKSKRIDDFSVTYRDGSSYDNFISDNEAALSKYRQCIGGDISHGAVVRNLYA